MEPYYYQQMNKQRQVVYHAILQGITALADEFQIPAIEGVETGSMMYFSSCGWIIRRYSGQQVSNTNFSRVHRIIFLSRNIFLRRIRSGSIRRR